MAISIANAFLNVECTQKAPAAYGHFACTNPKHVEVHNCEAIFRGGKKTPTFIRFSTVGGERVQRTQSAIRAASPSSSTPKRATGILVGNNTPVFFIRDPLKFGDFIHTQKRDPETNLKSPTMMWDFWSLSPESLHQVTILFSDRGTPDGYRHMDGFSSHTFSLINSKNETVLREVPLQDQSRVSKTRSR